jgi:glutamate synthase (NADPH/NADH) large chain
VHGGYNIIILSDRQVGPDRIADSGAAGDGGGAHHLIRKGLRTSVGLVVETGEAREVHHFCLPGRLWRRSDQPLSGLRHAARHACRRVPAGSRPLRGGQRYIKSIGKGILKVMSKMGISTYQSYCGAQIFDAVGLSSEFVDKYFTGTATTIEGIGLAEVAARDRPPPARPSPTIRCWQRAGSGRRVHVYRMRGEDHAWTPDAWPTCSMPCAATCRTVPRIRREVNEQNEHEDDSRAVPHQDRRRARPQAGSARRGRAGQGDRQALLHRRHVVRLDQPRGAHDAGAWP